MSSENSDKRLVLKDHTILIHEIFNIIKSDDFAKYSLGKSSECSRIGYTTKDKKNICVVMADDTALELGSPRHMSISRVLWSTHTGIADNTLYIKSENFSSMKNRSVSFLQLIILQFEDSDASKHFKMQSLIGLSNKIPGLMCRTLPGKMWIRIDHILMEKGFSLYSLGECLYSSYRDTIPGIKAMDIILIADNDPLIRKFEPMSRLAESISFNNSKVRWIEDGIISCDEVNCTSCDEKPVCDTLRQIVIEKREICQSLQQ